METTHVFINNEPIFVDELPCYDDDRDPIFNMCRVFKLDNPVYTINTIDGFERRSTINIDDIHEVLFNSKEKYIVIRNGTHPIYISYINKIATINIDNKIMDITMIDEPRVMYTRPFVMFNHSYGVKSCRKVVNEKSKRKDNMYSWFTDLYIHFQNLPPLYIMSYGLGVREPVLDSIDKIVDFINAAKSDMIESIEYDGNLYELEEINFTNGKIHIFNKSKPCWAFVYLLNLITGELKVTYKTEPTEENSSSE